MNTNTSRILTVGVVILKKDQVLLVKHGEAAGHVTGTYGTPGGRIDTGKNALDAAVREVKEETGLLIKKEDLIEFSDKIYADIKRKNNEIISVLHTVFVTNIFTGVLTDSEETIPEWIEIKKLTELNLLPNTIYMVEKAQQYVKK
nr:NUDIX domain protein [uncultured bacterium]